MEKATPGGAGGGSEPPATGKVAKKETLAQSGITTSTANRCEQLGKIPLDQFEAVIAEARKKNKPVSMN